MQNFTGTIIENHNAFAAITDAHYIALFALAGAFLFAHIVSKL